MAGCGGGPAAGTDEGVVGMPRPRLRRTALVGAAVLLVAVSKNRRDELPISAFMATKPGTADSRHLPLSGSVREVLKNFRKQCATSCWFPSEQ